MGSIYFINIILLVSCLSPHCKWRPAKLNVIADFTEDYARELEQRRLIEEQEKIENCFKDGELRKRLANAKF